ncbi:unnamed protein product [Amoebophrya sp. A120]|nr:unnamed protein product [Amoebophrya sp. A120]|eukprot:GSA120T00006338001.1
MVRTQTFNPLLCGSSTTRRFSATIIPDCHRIFAHIGCAHQNAGVTLAGGIAKQTTPFAATRSPGVIDVLVPRLHLQTQRATRRHFSAFPFATTGSGLIHLSRVKFSNVVRVASPSSVVVDSQHTDTQQKAGSSIVPPAPADAAPSSGSASGARDHSHGDASGGGSFSSKAKQALTLLGRFVQFFGLLHCLHEYGFDFCTTVGASMEPVFSETGNVLLYEKFSKYLYPVPVLGQVVVLNSPENPGVRVCKRVVALAGDLVVVRERNQDQYLPRGTGHQVPPIEDRIIRDISSAGNSNSFAPYHYRRPFSSTSTRVERVPQGHVWVEGDNKGKSNDSRHYGPVPLGLLEGRVRLCLWPPNSKSLYVAAEIAPENKTSRILAAKSC